MIRVVIVDDHPIVREGLKQILSRASDMEVVGEAGGGHEARVKLRSCPCDVVLLDISLPGRGGLEILSEIKKDRPAVAVLMLSVHKESEYAIRALKAGAAGYVTKKSAPEELVSAIRKAASGRKYVSVALAEALATALERPEERAPHEALSARELRVLCLIAEGKTVSEIAEELTLSPKTISTYRQRVLNKMGMSNNSQLMHYAMECGLLE